MNPEGRHGDRLRGRAMLGFLTALGLTAGCWALCYCAWHLVN